MRKLFTIIFLLPVFVNATNYYFSATGSDGAAGTSTGTAWQTLAKFNSSFAGFSPADSVLFKRGDTFYGSITISRSGSSGSPIIIGAYGTGAKPIITGFATVGAWSNLGSNIWESTSAISTLSYTNLVTINGVNIGMGRFPNTGYFPYQSFVTNTTITSSSINSATTNWTGAEAVIKKQRWIVDRNPITAHSGGTLTYTASSPYYGKDNWGFFIQADVRTLDLQNEWYYNPSTKKIDVYSTSSPATTQVTTIDTLVVIQTGKSYVTFDNISFTGANNMAIYTVNFSHLTIQNCNFDFNYTGVFGDDLGTSPNFVFNNNTVNHTNNNAIQLWAVYSGATVTNNVIKNTGMLVGMSGSSDGSGFGMYLAGDNQTGTLIQYNEVDSTGYIPILYTGTSGTISNNLVDYFCSVKDDGGGLYTHSAGTLKTISYNTVLNAIGNDDGVSDGETKMAHGIYVDRNSSTTNVNVLNNSIANIGYAGIFINGAQTGTNVRNNTVYNSYTSLYFSGETGFATNTSKNNIFFAKTATQLVFQEYPRELVTPNITSDSNYFARPILDSLVIAAFTSTPSYDYQLYTLAGWQTYSSQDAHSNKSPKTITDVNDLRFEYNATASPTVISLPFNYMDVRGVTYNGSITLAPYTSAVLIKNGAINSINNIIHKGKVRHSL